VGTEKKVREKRMVPQVKPETPDQGEEAVPAKTKTKTKKKPMPLPEDEESAK
jgi:hypothetical protein